MKKNKKKRVCAATVPSAARTGVAVADTLASFTCA
jgi:hypothetical protein